MSDRPTQATGDPICRKCASQEHGSVVPEECTCELATEFRPTDFRHVAQLLRSTDDKVVRASLSNWLNAIIAALDIAGNSGADGDLLDQAVAFVAVNGGTRRHACAGRVEALRRCPRGNAVRGWLAHMGRKRGIQG